MNYRNYSGLNLDKIEIGGLSANFNVNREQSSRVEVIDISFNSNWDSK